MFFDSVIDLISATSETANSIGNFINTEEKTKINASRQSIRQSEFYQAMSTGLKPELMFVIWAAEYSGQIQLEHEQKRYSIDRTYVSKKNPLLMELICSGLVGGR